MKPINIDADCKFLKDLEDTSTNVNLGMYNLICFKRDLQLYSKGIKPHRHWKISDVKRYFGMSGSVDQIHSNLKTIYNVLTEKEDK